MSRPRRLDVNLVEQASQAAVQATTVQELRAAQAVLLPARLGTTLTQTADILGVGRATAGRLQVSFRRTQSAPSTQPGGQRWGGRRRALMSPQEEKEFLAPWLEQAQAGGVLVVSPLRAALAQKLGRPVKPSVIYRLLARHNWRKVAPDTRHPKSDPVAQEDWKKNFHKRWLPSQARSR
jgi:transposase